MHLVYSLWASPLRWRFALEWPGNGAVILHPAAGGMKNLLNWNWVSGIDSLPRFRIPTHPLPPLFHRREGETLGHALPRRVQGGELYFFKAPERGTQGEPGAQPRVRDTTRKLKLWRRDTVLNYNRKRNVFIPHFSLRSLRPLRFQEKSVKMNFDDPIGYFFPLNTDVTSKRLRFFAPLQNDIMIFPKWRPNFHSLFLYKREGVSLGKFSNNG